MMRSGESIVVAKFTIGFSFSERISSGKGGEAGIRLRERCYWCYWCR